MSSLSVQLCVSDASDLSTYYSRESEGDSDLTSNSNPALIPYVGLSDVLACAGSYKWSVPFSILSTWFACTSTPMIFNCCDISAGDLL